jgi:L-seryl-tRNA(Ser) seleniumtransferase
VPGVRAERSFPNEAGQPLPRCKLSVDPAHSKITRDELAARLWDGDPRISVSTDAEDARGILLNPMTLTDEEVKIVEARLLDLLK